MQELGEAERTQLFERFGRTFEAGVTIYLGGDVADATYLLQEGRVRLVRDVRAGASHVTVVRRGELFGEDALVPGGRRAASAVALTDASALALDRATFAELLGASTDAAARLAEQLARRVRRVEEKLDNALLADEPSRVVHTLLRATAEQPPGSDGHVLRMSPLELASRSGLEVDAAKRVVLRLAEGDYLRVVDERIVVTDTEPLQHLFELLGIKEEVRASFL